MPSQEARRRPPWEPAINAPHPSPDAGTGPASLRSIISPEDQSATFVELFFDLVFVFGVTQLVYMLHHDLSWAGTGKAVLVFWMVWWAWTQFTWALNAADTTHPFVEIGTLLATAVAFFMAIAVPTALDDGRGLLFAIPYVGVRVIGLWLYARVASATEEMRRAVRSFATLSISGLATALLGGFLGGSTQLYLWGMTIALDVVAAVAAGDNESWTIHPEHFAERHGLIVIIALGESLIVAAAALTGVALDVNLMVVGALAVGISCGLWWTYFPIVKPGLEAGLVRASPDERASVARDIFSLTHFPMLCGVVAYAVGLEEALAHPSTALPQAARLSMAIGLFLFLAGSALAMWRAGCGAPLFRVVIAAVAGFAIFSVGGVAPLVTLGIAFAGVVLVAALDEWKAQRARAA